MQTKEEVLRQCYVEGNVVKLPAEQLDRKLYMEVAKALQLIGGIWKGNKIQGFVFQTDPTELLEQIAYGESRNLKKEFQFFATPAKLADRLVELASINRHHEILEPSAGQGAIIEAILRAEPEAKVYAIELMDVNCTILTKKGFYCDNLDFLATPAQPVFDRIIANPPFSKNQDIDHILQMYGALKPGGRLVSIASKHWQKAINKKETSFRDWLSEVSADIHEIPQGEFKESGTNIATVIVVIDKAA